jgi:hypothetical protein
MGQMPAFHRTAMFTGGTPGILVKLREQLEAARALGEPFDEAWPKALRMALNEHREREKGVSWAAILDETRYAWEACYVDGQSYEEDHAWSILAASHHEEPVDTVHEAIHVRAVA